MAQDSSMPGTFVAVALIAVALAVVWYLAARLIGLLAAQRGEDEDEWFRRALVMTPFLAWLLLVGGSRPPGGRR